MAAVLVTFTLMKVFLKKKKNLKAGRVRGSIRGQLIPSALDSGEAEQHSGGM